MAHLLGFASVFVLFGVILIGGPLLTIWTFNTLFNLGIEYTPATWFAALWLGFVFAPLKKFK